MPVNKNALYRIRKIDEVLRTYSRYGVSFSKLKEEVESYMLDRFKIESVSERTLRADFRHMEELYDVTIKSLKDGYYQYDPPDSSIFKSPLNEDDADKLQEVLQILRQFNTLPQFGDVAEILLKLEEKVAIRGRQKVSVLEFDAVVTLKGIEFLEDLYHATSTESALVIDYQPYSEQKESFVFSPCYLKEYNNRWFVFGRKNMDADVVTLAIDRIVSINQSKSQYQFSLNFNPVSYFGPIIGVTRPVGKSEVELTLKFKNPRGQYVKTKPLHKSQVLIEESSKQVIIKICIIPNNEMYAQLLSFGSDLTIVRPKEIKLAMKDKIQAMYKLYH